MLSIGLKGLSSAEFYDMAGLLLEMRQWQIREHCGDLIHEYYHPPLKEWLGKLILQFFALFFLNCLLYNRLYKHSIFPEWAMIVVTYFWYLFLDIFQYVARRWYINFIYIWVAGTVFVPYFVLFVWTFMVFSEYTSSVPTKCNFVLKDVMKLWFFSQGKNKSEYIEFKSISNICLIYISTFYIKNRNMIMEITLI